MFLRAFLTFIACCGLASCGGGGSEAAPATTPPAASKPTSVTPATPPQLHTLIGDRDAVGLHWIFVGDGFTTAELPALRGAALAMAREMLDAPELAAHTDVWNVHLLEVGSTGSGVDDAARGIAVTTPFDGKLGCGSNTRVACVDWQKIDTALRGLRAPLAEVTVILNTRDYVGSTNGSGIIVSLNEHAPRVVVHEMGHRVAGLADEYVDDVVAEEWRPLYVEGRFPNVTTVTDASLSPWRHWLEDGADVGLYEGAFYVSNGFYRPKRDSIMRTLESPIGQVNAEAWLRAQYRSLPPFSAVSPAAAEVSAAAGETLEFSIDSAWSAAAVSLHWYLDGEEIAEARGAPVYRLAADGGSHDLEVRAQDASGRIRSPGATEARRQHTWRVAETAPAASAGKAAPTAAEWLRLRVDATGHRLVAREAASPLHSNGFSPHAYRLHYSLLGDDGDVLASGTVADPRVSWSALPAPGEAPGSHVPVMLESGDYVVGIPAGIEPRKLRIAADPAGQWKHARNAGSGAVEIDLDLP